MIEKDDLSLYQRRPVEIFSNSINKSSKIILEIGSDIQCKVLEYIADQTLCFTIGVDKSPNFGKNVNHERVFPIQGEGERLPLADNSIDGVLSIATMEHVGDIPGFLGEIARVLRPGGVFYTDFGPLWSCAVGHHVFAQVDGKEARFWKEGRNPIPDYFHLLLSKTEMRDFLAGGPCDGRLISPIVDWIYERDVINRYFFEDYRQCFINSEFDVKYVSGRPRLNQKPSSDVLKKLIDMHGDRDYISAYIEAFCHKKGAWIPQLIPSGEKFEVLEGILRDPITGGKLHYSKEKSGYISQAANAFFPLRNGVVCLQRDRGQTLSQN